MNVNGTEITAGEMLQEELPAIEKKCVMCGRTFPTRQFRLLPGSNTLLSANICNRCGDARDARRETSAELWRRNVQLKAWETICPTIYRDTDVTKLPCDYESQQKVLDWTPSNKHMALYGPPRVGKTRMVFMLLKRLHELMEVYATTATDFGHHIAAKFGDSSREGHEYVTKCAECEILFIDELGKEKMTDRIESEFLWVLDQRCIWKRPMFITTNLMGEHFKQIWSRDRSSAILGRFKEFFTWIPVTARTEETKPQT